MNNRVAKKIRREARKQGRLAVQGYLKGVGARPFLKRLRLAWKILWGR